MSSCCSPGGADLQTCQQDTQRRATGAHPVPVGVSARRRPQGEFVLIPTGNFAMGDHHGTGYPADGETPVHQVHLDAFRMGATTVTNAEFAAFVQDTGYHTTAEHHGVSAVFYAAFQGQRSDILRQVPDVFKGPYKVRWRHQRAGIKLGGFRRSPGGTRLLGRR